MNTRGIYIVIEGIEAVGKTTVIERLARELQAAQIPVQLLVGTDNTQSVTAQAVQRIIDDPRYPVSKHAEVLLYNAARSQALEVVRQTTATGVICLADRSYLTTLVQEYYGHGDIPDYTTANQIIQFAASNTQPDLLILLDAPVSTVKARLTADRQAAFDEAYQERLRAGYLWEAKQRDLPIVFATEPVDTVFAAIWQQVSSLISTPARPASASGTQSVGEVLAAKPPAQATAAEPPVVVPPTQAPAGQATGLAISADSASPAPQTDNARPAKDRVTIDAASELFAGRLAQIGGLARITQAADTPGTKDTDGRYRYYVPTNLSDGLRGQYIRNLDQLFDTYAGLITSLTKHLQSSTASGTTKRIDAEAHARAALRPLLPVAATTAITVRAPVRTLERLAIRLQSENLRELSLAGQQLAAAVGGDTPHTGTFQAVQKLADDLLSANHTASTAEPVTLVNYIPRSELDLVADILYEHSDLPLAGIQRTAASTPYQRKTDVLAAYLGDQPDSRSTTEPTLEAVRYHFDITCSYAVFRELQQSRPFRRAIMQRLSPRLGYEVPALVEAAGAADVFEQCFGLSLQLYSALQAGGFPLEAQYATLFGHNLRWSITISARDALRLREVLTSAQASYTKEAHALMQLMLAKLTEVHPVLAEAMHLQLHAEPATAPPAELPVAQPTSTETA